MLKRFSFSLSHSLVKFAQFFVGLEPLDCILYYFISSVKFILLPPYTDHEYFDSFQWYSLSRLMQALQFNCTAILLDWDMKNPDGGVVLSGKHIQL